MIGHLSKFNDEVQELGKRLVQAAMQLHKRVASTFRKTASNFHYEVRPAARGSAARRAAECTCPALRLMRSRPARRRSSTCATWRASSKAC